MFFMAYCRKGRVAVWVSPIAVSDRMSAQVFLSIADNSRSEMYVLFDFVRCWYGQSRLLSFCETHDHEANSARHVAKSGASAIGGSAWISSRSSGPNRKGASPGQIVVGACPTPGGPRDGKVRDRRGNFCPRTFVLHRSHACPAHQLHGPTRRGVTSALSCPRTDPSGLPMSPRRALPLVAVLALEPTEGDRFDKSCPLWHAQPDKSKIVNFPACTRLYKKWGCPLACTS